MDDAEVRSSSANQSPTLPAESPTDFTHSPINYSAPSIRLVRIQASRSSDGSLQCRLRHASTTSTYLCLSYVWGVDDRYQWILVNGRRFRIRQNLYNFLRVARQQQQWRSRWFWIDALCIDQNNATERNHQVKQMGNIFAGAVQVVAWLGTKKQIVNFLQSAREWKERQDHPSKKLKESRKEAGIREEDTQEVSSSSDSDKQDKSEHGWKVQDHADGFRHFCYADYWDRAWITQEVALARHITFMAGKASLPARSISFAHEQFCQLRVAALDPRTTPELRGRSLIYLMDRFKSKMSGVVRDRVFSLLSLCGEGSDVAVDYDVTDLQVAENILDCCKRSFCLCSISIVASVLCVQSQLPLSNYVWKSRSDYAQITLSMISDPDEFRSKKTLSALYAPDRRGSILTLKLGFLCRSYHGLLRASMDHTGNTTSVYYDARYYNGGWDIYLLEGFRIEFSFDQQSCTAIFSLKFLHEIIQVNRSLKPCCERVACEGTTSAWPSSMPALTLCE